MAHQDTENNTKTTKPKRGLRWRAAMALLPIAVGIALAWLSEQSTVHSLDEHLAAIEAARAIPDSENAAVIYNRLIKDYGNIEVPSGVVNVNTDTTAEKPWLSDDNPQLRMWIDQEQPLITGLIEATRIKQCRFPLTGYPQDIPQRRARSIAMRSWAFLLFRAGNNHVAEGRIESAVRKYLVAITMGAHIAQQPVIVDRMLGLAIECVALSRMRSFVVDGPFAQTDLKAIEAALPPIRNEWDSFSPETAQVDRLYRRKQPLNLLDSVLRFFGRKPNRPNLETLHDVYLVTLASRRVTLILIALRRCKDNTGRWPRSLDEISRLLPADALVDPGNGGAFVYRLTEDGFTLYSRGRNNIDENGSRKAGADDWRIWP